MWSVLREYPRLLPDDGGSAPSGYILSQANMTSNRFRQLEPPIGLTYHTEAALNATQALIASALHGIDVIRVVITYSLHGFDLLSGNCYAVLISGR